MKSTKIKKASFNNRKKQLNMVYASGKEVSVPYGLILAEQLHTSDNQIQRLLNPKILNKNLAQLYQIGALLGLEVGISMKVA